MSLSLLPRPLEVLTTKLSVLQHVPKSFRVDWCELLAEEVNNFCEEQTEEALTLLLMLPKVILVSMDRGKKNQKTGTAEDE